MFEGRAGALPCLYPGLVLLIRCRNINISFKTKFRQHYIILYLYGGAALKWGSMVCVM